MSDAGTPGHFDPAEYPDGIICADCGEPLTRDNVAQIDITDPPGTPPWDAVDDDEPRVFLMKCVACALTSHHD